ncbi:MAG: dihydrofolate reductase [Patescibacteria group bacterium]|nr:dihydrofolate reductase [Patescibacteria group bacterium]
MKISLIAALSENRVIGKDNKLIWHIPDDLKHFKEITLNHPVIMGRRTYESIGRILPDRTNIIITRDKEYKIEGAIVVNSLDDAISVEQKENIDEIFIIGGGQIFEQAISLADKLYLTVIEGSFDGDTFFPDYSNFKKTSESETFEYNGMRYRFEEWEK